jgi:nicotinic acid phosphoribosyltransferase
MTDASSKWILDRNDKLIEVSWLFFVFFFFFSFFSFFSQFIQLNETHPNASNAKNNDGLLHELQTNLNLLETRVQGKDKKKKDNKKKDQKKDKKKSKKKDAKKVDQKTKKDLKKDQKKKDQKKKDKKKKKADKKKAESKAKEGSFFGTFGIPLGIMTDSYKAAHFEMYPEAQKMVAYGEFRAPYKDLKNTEGRFVSYGMRYLIDTYLNRRWTNEDVDRARDFYATHNIGNTKFPFPEHLFRKFIKENKGYFPVKIQALRDGTVAHIHTPVYQISAHGEYSRLVTYLETVLTHIWYPSSVATLSRKCRDLIGAAFKTSVDEENMGVLDSRLHDFGFRGCSCLEQAVLGGSAHLLSFDGSDTMPASYYVQYHLNNGRPVGTSIPASEHSVMTAFSKEKEAFAHMIELYGDNIFSVVMDSYDYERALNEIVPSLKDQVLKKGGFMVYRPDSGDPIEAVVQGLRAAEATFGATTNSKGYKVVNTVGVLQGDGISVGKVVFFSLAFLFSDLLIISGAAAHHGSHSGSGLLGAVSGLWHGLGAAAQAQSRYDGLCDHAVVHPLCRWSGPRCDEKTQN